jgi:hypothetical protein
VTPAASSRLRIVAFGDLDAGVWGAGLADGGTLFIAGRGTDSWSGQARLDAGEDAGDWTLTAQGAELEFSPAAEAVLRSDEQLPGGFDQLCRVRGTVADGSAIDCLGRRATTIANLRDLESIRDVSAWFAPDEGVALTALRPRKARGHNRDLIAAAVLDAAAVAHVPDPRLSTTYDAEGRPARVGLELWLEEQDGEQQYPRRAAGEAAGSPASASDDGHDVIAQALRCHSRGSEGTGVYLLVRPR